MGSRVDEIVAAAKDANGKSVWIRTDQYMIGLCNQCANEQGAYLAIYDTKHDTDYGYPEFAIGVRDGKAMMQIADADEMHQVDLLKLARLDLDKLARHLDSLPD